MDTLLYLIATYGLLVVAVSVFFDQGGIPVPAYPPIIVTTSMAAQAGESVLPILAVATAAAVAADWFWFIGGRRLGARLVRLMCKLSLSPDSCVLRTRGIYGRWGPVSLTVAKFVPGFAAVATTMAGETGVSTRRFLLFDGIGAVLWSGLAVAIGVAFKDVVGSVLLQLDELGRYGLMLVLVAIVGFVLWKWLNRHRVLRQLRMARITPDELHEMIENGGSPLILDVRAADQRERTGWIPGAVFVNSVRDVELAAQEQVIIYCDCPNELSAAVLARELQKRGFGRVRPLAGGFTAWRDAGRAVALSSQAG
ncbi:rhodanese-like domain-containing protein [Lysobacter niastensis]|uniref:Sulfurtransferase n=1 Tax=Lysobacter niastensis TaxID=380629 RepID=A0ABS0B7N9_9GAMM|nr:rhodanese-like domain-containing protein [Lysobacter niastensis]MBF6023130.1 sulfurtransferase [Lysobacter niastensis]